MKITILDYLKDSVERFPDKVALVDEKERITYREFGRRIYVTAAAFVWHMEQGGEVFSRRPVVVFLDKGISALVSFMGVAYTGNIYVPFDVSAPMERLNRIMDVIDPVYVITDRAHDEKARGLSLAENRILLVESLMEEEPDKKAEHILAAMRRNIIDTDPLYIICTSGSTGIPKGVVISHRAVMDFTEEASEVMGFSEKEVFASQAPFYFDASVPDIYCNIRNGATLHIIPGRKFTFPLQVLEYLKEQGVNAIFWVPSALVTAANLKAVSSVDLSCLKKVMFCGEVMPVKQYNVWKQCIPEAVFVNYYGPSEATYASTYFIINRDFTEEERLPIGGAALNTGILVLDDDNQPVAGDGIGELCIRGSGLASGYYNNPEKTKESFVQNPLQDAYPEIIYRTGDLVHYNRYGELEYVGRRDFQIKHQGYRIELGEIETAAGSIGGISGCACVYDHKRGRIVLFYTGEQKKPREIGQRLSEMIPKYMVPGTSIWLESIPYNANGKIDRKGLLEGFL